MRRSVRRAPVTAETLMLTAIHTWAARRAPRLRRLVPERGNEGDPIVLEGEGFGSGELTVSFGDLTTWAVVLSDEAALALVPANASAGPVAVSRQGLRSNSGWFGGPSDETPTRVVRIDPSDGATGVFKDTPVVARLSQPGDPSSLSPRTFRVLDEAGEVPARVRMSRDGTVVIWQAERLLEADVPHLVTCSGLKDRRGRQVSPHLSQFVVCDLSRADLGT
jgi:hypothetical protein